MPIKKIFKPLASLKLAVFVLLAIGVLVAWGTIVESIYNDAKMAQETVYHSWMSYGIFGLLSINLIAVIVDRYPWKRRHLAFILAHVGILILLVGSLVTKYYGVDGSLRFEIGGKQNKVTVSDVDLTVYSSLDGQSFRKVFDQQVFFLSRPPTSKKPLIIPLPSGDITINEFYPYSLVETTVVPTETDMDGAAVRFQIANDRVNQTNWIIASAKEQGTVSMGPASIILSQKNDLQYTGGNVLFMYPKDSTTLNYQVYSEKKKGLINSGEVRPGEKFDLGWMNLTLRLLKYLPKAREEYKYVPMERASELTTSAIKFIYNGKENWLGLNSMARFYGNSEIYVITYGNRAIPLGFDLALKDFKVGRYQGTMRASSYESLVTLPEDGNREILISMNEPLDYKGYTFYQASFQEDEMGKPIASILSVNYDPGRWLKYVGSLLIVFGAAYLFYGRWQRGRKQNA